MLLVFARILYKTFNVIIIAKLLSWPGMVETRLNEKYYSWRYLKSIGLSNQRIVEAAVEGHCCWIIFPLSNTHKRGMPLPMGFKGPIRFQPKSILRETC